MSDIIGVRKFVNEALLDQAWSPDAAEITTQYSYIPVFLYGTEKVGYAEDLGKRGPPRIGVGWTTGPTFTMYLHQKEKYPVVLLAPLGANRAKVYGHIFMCDPETLFELDAKYQNNCYFKRYPRWITYCAPESRGTANATRYTTRAWMYVGMPSEWKDRIEARELALLPKMTPRDGEPFYIFANETKTEPQAM